MAPWQGWEEDHSRQYRVYSVRHPFWCQAVSKHGQAQDSLTRACLLPLTFSLGFRFWLECCVRGDDVLTQPSTGDAALLLSQKASRAAAHS